MRNFSTLNRQRGFSMVEMLIAVGISAFLLLIVAVMFSSTSSLRALQTSLAGINETGRFAISMLSRDLRLAGYVDSDFLDGAGVDSITVVSDTVANGGDSITIRYETDKDCNYADTVGGIAVNIYSIDATNLTLVCNDEPLVDDIEQMQIYLGQDTDGDGVANRMMAPDDAGLDMAQVVSLRLNLLVRSPQDGRASSAQTYVFDDTTVTATDGRLRREYSITVALRNPI